MTQLQPTATETASDTVEDPPKLRPCLRCGTEFPSAWSGERVCRHCKSTSVWRNG